jgi:hypothetical protein
MFTRLSPYMRLRSCLQSCAYSAFPCYLPTELSPSKLPHSRLMTCVITDVLRLMPTHLYPTMNLPKWLLSGVHTAVSWYVHKNCLLLCAYTVDSAYVNTQQSPIMPTQLFNAMCLQTLRYQMPRKLSPALCPLSRPLPSAYIVVSCYIPTQLFPSICLDSCPCHVRAQLPPGMCRAYAAFFCHVPTPTYPVTWLCICLLL